jgi:biopolymer transport protein ExbB
MKKSKKLLMGSLVYCMVSVLVAEPGASTMKKQVSGSFISVVMDSGLVGISIWLMLFATSIVTLWLLVDALMNIKTSKLCPENSISEVKKGLDSGDVDYAITLCKENPSLFTIIMHSCLKKISKGFESMEGAANSTVEVEEEKLMQRINYLNLCGAIAPMLGLLGTVTGMVSAFFTLGSSTGVEKAQLLALAISQALYTTAAGLIISVPALVAYNIFKNKATTLVICTERHVADILEDIKDRV